jgi:hypothetical protein
MSPEPVPAADPVRVIEDAITDYPHWDSPSIRSLALMAVAALRQAGLLNDGPVERENGA